MAQNILDSCSVSSRDLGILEFNFKLSKDISWESQVNTHKKNFPWERKVDVIFRYESESGGLDEPETLHF